MNRNLYAEILYTDSAAHTELLCRNESASEGQLPVERDLAVVTLTKKFDATARFQFIYLFIYSCIIQKKARGRQLEPGWSVSEPGGLLLIDNSVGLLCTTAGADLGKCIREVYCLLHEVL